jgi:two-component system, LuxR family, response regulator DctR
MSASIPSRSVYVVEDEPAVRDALVWLLASRALVTREYASGELFLAGLPKAAEVACVVLDVRMGGISGLEVFERLRQSDHAANVPVIFLTGHADVPMAVEAVKNGAFDFFEKPFNNNRLVDRVIEALDYSEAQLRSHTQSADRQRRLAQLTPREKEVMLLILSGKLNKLIADELGISMRTVELHRSNIFTKLGVRSAVELAGWLKE